MAAEDFEHYSHLVPSCFYLLGSGNQQKGNVSSLHTATFDIDETAIIHSMAIMTWAAISTLNEALAQ